MGESTWSLNIVLISFVSAALSTVGLGPSNVMCVASIRARWRWMTQASSPPLSARVGSVAWARDLVSLTASCARAARRCCHFFQSYPGQPKARKCCSVYSPTQRTMDGIISFIYPNGRLREKSGIIDLQKYKIVPDIYLSDTHAKNQNCFYWWNAL